MRPELAKAKPSDTAPFAFRPAHQDVEKQVACPRMYNYSGSLRSTRLCQKAFNGDRENLGSADLSLDPPHGSPPSPALASTSDDAHLLTETTEVFTKHLDSPGLH
jgi:hypothetical protein